MPTLNVIIELLFFLGGGECVTWFHNSFQIECIPFHVYTGFINHPSVNVVPFSKLLWIWWLWKWLTRYLWIIMSSLFSKQYIYGLLGRCTFILMSICDTYCQSKCTSLQSYQQWTDKSGMSFLTLSSIPYLLFFLIIAILAQMKLWNNFDLSFHNCLACWMPLKCFLVIAISSVVNVLFRCPYFKEPLVFLPYICILCEINIVTLYIVWSILCETYSHKDFSPTLWDSSSLDWLLFFCLQKYF